MINNFFQENSWASCLILLIIAVFFGVFMYQRTNKTFESLEEANPKLNIYKRVFGKAIGKVVPFILFLLFIVLSWLLTKIYQ